MTDATATNRTSEAGESFQPDVQPLTFGGVVPDLNDVPETPETGFSGVSLVGKSNANEGLVSLVGGSQPPKLTDEELTRKVDKFSFALGKTFSREDISRYLAAGSEEQLRKLAASQKDNEDEAHRTATLKDILSSGMPAEPDQQQTLLANVKTLGAFKPANDPSTIVEEAYAKNFTQSVPLVGPKDNALLRLEQEATDKVLYNQSRERVEKAQDTLLSAEERAERIKLYQENAKDVLEKAEQTYSKESLFGKIIDFGKSAVPFADYYNMSMDVPGMEAVGLLPGTSIAQWVTKLYDQPPAVQKQWLNTAVETIGSYNPALAVRVAEAAVSYTTTDKYLDNVFGVLDLSDVGDAARLGKTALLAGAAYVSRKEIVNAYKAAIRADADPRRDPAAFKAAMGDINGAAAQNVLSKSPGKLQNPIETSSATPTVFNTKANPGSSDGLAGAQTGRLWAYIRDRADRFQEKVDAAIRVNRLPEEALQAAFEGTDAEFRQAIAQSLNNAIQNVRREVPLSAAEQKLDRYLAERGADMSHVPRVEPDAILRPEQIPLDDPMREQLIKHYERKKAAKDERDETLRQLAEEGSIKVEPPAEAPKALEPTIEGTPVRPEHTSENLGRWEYEITKPDGETFSGRHWKKEMAFWARQMGMEVGDYGARQTGNGWVMTVTVPVDETKPYVRAALKTNKNGTNPIAPLMVKWRRGGGRVSEFSSNNRIAYVVGQEKLREVIEPLARPLLNLDRDQIKDLNRVMSEEMNRIDPSNDLPGYFYEDMAEFESAYRRLNGRSPSAKESDAYLSARTLYELEYGMRSHSYYKELARLGLKKVTLPITKVDPKTGMKSFSKTSFEGKVIDRIPLDARDAKERAMVAIYHEGEEPKILPLNALATEGRQGRIEEMQKQGYKIIQTGNAPRKPGKEVFGEDESINFIITKDAHFSPLEAGLGRREGWHQIYPQRFFVKQPVVRKVEKDGLVHHYYEGEVAWAGFHTEAEARKFEKAMETARRIAFEGAAGDLEQHLAEHLPYKEKKFRELFEDTVKKDGTVVPAYFSKTEPFLSLSDGSISMDAYKELMESRYANLYDTIRSPWNIMNQVDKKFVGHRDELLHTIKEGKGSQGNPVFNLTRAEILDPLSAMSDGVTNMIRNHHMIDLRLQFGESWVNEFKHLFNKNEQALYNDLVNTIMNPPWIPNVQNIAHDEYLKAENARLAFLELLNLETPFQASMENLKSKLLDQVYTRLGQNYSDGLATSRLMQTRHPLAFLRGVVFHTGVGMFNPMPAMQNVAQIANAIAISPKHGLAAAGFSIYAYMTRLNGHPQIVREIGKIAQKATGGAYKAEWFEEGIELMKGSGYWSVGGSHSFADHLNDPKLTATRWTGKVLDAGAIFFTETEKQLRTTAFFTAYLEHKAANSTKAVNAIDLNEILARANTLAGRMTRDQKARWQSGEIMSTWGQFFSYNARLMEMVLERGFGRKDALTVPERLRLLGMNTLLYGVPIGFAGSLVGGFVNPYDHIKKAFVDNQIDVDDGWVEKFMDGVVGHMSKALTGVNVSPALGPTGRDLFKSLEQDFGWFRFVMGASGGKIVDVYKSTDHLMASTWLALNGKISPKAVGRDLLDIFRNVATIDKTTKMYLALVNHNLYTRQGQQINPLDEPVDPIAGIVSAITGQLPSDYDYAMYEKKIMDEMPQIIRQLGKQAQHDYRLMLQATADQDYDTAAFYANRITYWTKGIPEREEAERILHEAMKRDKPLVDQIREHKAHHWTDVSESWKKAFGKYFSNVNPTND